MTARHILAEVYAWVAAEPEGVRPMEIEHYLCAHHGRKSSGGMDSFLATMEYNGFCLTEEQGRIYAMDGLIMENEGPGRATVYYQGDPVGTVKQMPGLPHEPREWRAYNLRGEYVGKAYGGKQAAKLLEGEQG
jgi:hypothetical protein